LDTEAGWTGESACLLQTAMRMSNQSFATRLGIGLRTVAKWHELAERRPSPELQQILDSTLAQAEPEVRERFGALIGKIAPVVIGLPPAETLADDSARSAAENRLAADASIGQALTRLDHLAGWEPGTARSEVAVRLAKLDRRHLQDRADRRSRIGQPSIAAALADYYQDTGNGYGLYQARTQGTEITTSVLTHPEWLDLECSLTSAHDRLKFTSAASQQGTRLGIEEADAAAQRLAETLTAGTRFTESTLYRLASIDIAKGKLGGTMGLSPFTSYALTLDLLEGELTDALAAGIPPQRGSLPLRDRYLPDVSSVLDVGNRLCAGGALALCAFARPATHYREHPDYVLLVS
jgi:hypothetical protein